MCVMLNYLDFVNVFVVFQNKILKFVTILSVNMIYPLRRCYGGNKAK